MQCAVWEVFGAGRPIGCCFQEMMYVMYKKQKQSSWSTSSHPSHIVCMYIRTVLYSLSTGTDMLE